jgi:hypothetical protein
MGSVVVLSGHASIQPVMVSVHGLTDVVSRSEVELDSELSGWPVPTDRTTNGDQNARVGHETEGVADFRLPNWLSRISIDSLLNSSLLLCRRCRRA